MRETRDSQLEDDLDVTLVSQMTNNNRQVSTGWRSLLNDFITSQYNNKIYWRFETQFLIAQLQLFDKL